MVTDGSSATTFAPSRQRRARYRTGSRAHIQHAIVARDGAANSTSARAGASKKSGALTRS